jgi:hypothetical protein
MHLIETSHLKSWSDSRSAQSQLPYYVKRLISAVIQPEKLRIPSGDAVWLPGLDGEVMNSETNRFVPKGQSVWEVGTQTRIKSKANKDYAKRTKDKGGKKEESRPIIKRSEKTFVFVTPRIWKDKAKWVTERKAEKIWNDVVVIDGVDLQDWLEAAPVVMLQLAAEMHLVPEAGLYTLDQAWEDWSRLTNPPISEELVVTGREEQEKNLVGSLIDIPSTFTVRGDSPREALGFILAVLRKFNSKERNLSFDARIIVTEDETVGTQLQHYRNLIIVLKQTRSQVSGLLSSKGHHVIIPEGNSVHTVHNLIELARPFHHQFVDALKKINLSDDEAERIARECGLSITILQRRRPNANFTRPTWSDGELAFQLLPALLANRWNNRNEADREILCQLADVKDYESVESQLQPLLWVDESPLRRVDELWTLSASADAFQLMARHLTIAHLNRFKAVFREVFGRIDPKVDLPLDEWLFFDIKGEKSHSRWLRSGLADTLLLIAERGINDQLSCIPSPQVYVDELVNGIPGLQEDWRVLASIRDQYARLMEAAPNPLLNSLEHMLEARPHDVRRIFAEGDAFFGENMHTGLLWGLETLAWSTEYLPRVALALSVLASIDPGGRIQNRPINSLREIFLWWHPCTNANNEERLNAIDLILDHQPEIGWELLSMLLPDVHSVSSGTARPRWRDFGDLSEDARLRNGQMQYVAALGDRALANVNGSPERWRKILNSLRGLPSAQREKALELLKDWSESTAPVDAKSALWDVLRNYISQHRTYQKAEWAIPTGLINRLDEILPILAPTDPIEGNIWLFNDWLPGLPDGEEEIDRRQEKINVLRKQVVENVLQVKGIDGLVELGLKCEYPGLVASSLVPLISVDDLSILIKKAISIGDKGVLLAGQVSGQAHHFYGEAWRNKVQEFIKTEAWSPPIAAALVIYWPDGKATWEFVKALKIASEYWRQKPIFLIKGSIEEQVYQIDHMIEVGRSSQAFQYIANWMEGVPTTALIRLFDATLGELARAKTIDDIKRLGLNSYDLQRFLSELHNRKDLPREELARREYQALPLLGLSDIEGLTLQDFMAEDANFFINVICEAFLPAHRDKSKEFVPSAEEKIRGQSAYSLINGMNVMPGRDGMGINEQKLTQWVEEVRKKAGEKDREVIADEQIGSILAHSPNDPEDKGWPHRVVRNLLEKLNNDHINLGLKIGRFNMRGVVSRNPYEGGVQERALASQYHEWAVLSRTKWPRMASLLGTIAQEWEDLAKREDARAEQEKLE